MNNIEKKIHKVIIQELLIGPLSTHLLLKILDARGVRRAIAKEAINRLLTLGTVLLSNNRKKIYINKDCHENDCTCYGL